MKGKILKYVGLSALMAQILVNSVYAQTFSETLANIVPERTGLIDYANMDTKERFHARRAEVPEEIKVIMPFEVTGEWEIYVSPDGSPLNPGTKEQPVKTLQNAMNIVERADYTKRKNGVIIYLREGEYTIDESVKLSGKHSGMNDAPLYISSYNNENVVLSSSDVVSLKDFTPVTDSAVLERFYPKVRDKIVEIDLPAHGITEYGSIYYHYEQGKEYSKVETQIFLDDEKMTLSRYPNGTDTLRVGEAIDLGAETLAEDNGRGHEWVMADDVPFNWVNTDEIGCYAYLSYNYNPEPHRVMSFNKEKNSIRCYGIAHFRQIRNSPECTYYFYNVLEELDTEGEYFLDRSTGKLYFYPPEYADENSKIYLSTRSNNLFELQDTKNVVFNGLTFTNSSAKGIFGTNCKNVVIQNCEFERMSDGGVRIESSANCGVTTSFFNTSGTFGAYVGGPDGYDMYNNFIQNCMLDGGGTNSKFRCGGNGSVMSHNFMVNSTHGVFQGKGLNWYLEYNESAGGNKEQHDGGEYYTGDALGTSEVVRYNYFHNPSIRPKRGRTFYFDEGGSSFLAYGNVAQGSEYGSFSHNGKLGAWFNNIFIDTRAAMATSANYYSQYRTFRDRAFQTHTQSWYWMANAHTFDPTTYMWKRSYPEQEQLFDYVNDWHAEINEDKNAPNMGVAEKWLLSANYFYLGNNLLVNTSNEIATTSTDTIIDENNISIPKESLKDPDHGDVTIVDEEIYKQIPEFEAIPMEKIGLIKDCDMWRNLKLGEMKKPTYPKSGYENRVSPKDIRVSWRKAIGAPFYRVIIAEDESFENIVHDEKYEAVSITVDLEPEKHYYLKVIALATSNTLGWAENESPVSDFYTMTLSEANAVLKAEKKELRIAIQDAQAICDKMVEGDKPGEYKQGAKIELQNTIKAATQYMEETNIQGYIDAKTQEVNKSVFEAQKKVNVGNIVQIDPNVQYWSKIDNPDAAGAQTMAINMQNGEDGRLVINTELESITYVKNSQAIPYGSFATAKIKIDDIESSWMVLAGLSFNGGQYNLGKNDFYSIVTSKNGEGNPSIELQKYKFEGGRKEFLSYVNAGEIKSNEWCDIAIGAIPYEEGTRFIFIANGTLIYDYYDTFENGAYYTDSYFMHNRNAVQVQTEIAKSDLTYDEIMKIVNSAK